MIKTVIENKWLKEYNFVWSLNVLNKQKKDI